MFLRLLRFLVLIIFLRLLLLLRLLFEKYLTTVDRSVLIAGVVLKEEEGITSTCLDGSIPVELYLELAPEHSLFALLWISVILIHPLVVLLG
jgi:hypothetical protein